MLTIYHVADIMMVWFLVLQVDMYNRTLMEFADRQSDFGPNVPSHGVWVNNGNSFSTVELVSQHCTRCLALLIRNQCFSTR